MRTLFALVLSLLILSPVAAGSGSERTFLPRVEGPAPSAKSKLARLTVENYSAFDAEIYVGKTVKKLAYIGTAPALTASYADLKQGNYVFYAEAWINEVEYLYWGPARMRLTKSGYTARLHD
jgi:hypothetical protein